MDTSESSGIENVKNDHINLDFNNEKPDEKIEKIYGQEYLATRKEPIANISKPPQEESKQVKPANALDIRAAGHPKICILHFIFKLASILCMVLISSTVLCFVLTLVFASFDFWVVKNISGRKLVLLKWESVFEESGKEKWVFISTSPGKVPHSIDSTFFWVIQVGTCGFWIVLSIIELFTFSFFWLILALACLILSGVNLSGFYRCRGEHQKKVKLYMAKIGLQQIQRMN